jgi:hypothetical protein
MGPNRRVEANEVAEMGRDSSWGLEAFPKETA